MFRFVSLRRIALALAVLGLAAPVATARPSPLKGVLEGVVERTPLPGLPPRVAVYVEGAGDATQLGRFTFEFPHVVNPATRTAVGAYTFTTANGDTLTADVTGQSTPIEGTAFLYIEESATVTGGTGWYAGATGTFTVYRLFDTVNLTTTGVFVGSLSFGPGKK